MQGVSFIAIKQGPSPVSGHKSKKRPRGLYLNQDPQSDIYHFGLTHAVHGPHGGKSERKA